MLHIIRNILSTKVELLDTYLLFFFMSDTLVFATFFFKFPYFKISQMTMETNTLYMKNKCLYKVFLNPEYLFA